jgi:DNA polymerase-1
MRVHGYGWDTIPVDCPYYWGYGVLDTILTRRLYDDLYLAATGPEYDQEMAYRAIMYRAEQRGMCIDVAYCEALRAEWEADAHALSLQLQAYGIKNPNSNQMVEATLRGHGWEPSDFTESGQAQLDKLVLAELKAMPAPLCDIAESLIEYKRKVKWISTYLDTFLQDRDSNDRVHASVRTLGARTGRSSITNPPLQTLPHTPHIRTAVLPYEGEKLWAVDYSGQEYRTLAHYSQDPAWLHEFRHGAGDPHTMVAEMLGIQRDQAKTFNFAMVYGAGPRKLATATGLSVAQVEHFLKLYASRFPKVAEFIEQVQRDGNTQLRAGQEPFVTTIGGRKVYGEADRLFALTNYLCQGSGADILKRAAIELDRCGYADRIIVPVHDEFVFSLPEGENAEDIRQIMETAVELTVPLTCEAEGPFENWGEKYG